MSSTPGEGDRAAENAARGRDLAATAGGGAQDEVVFRAFRWSLAALGLIGGAAFFAWLLFAPVVEKNYAVNYVKDDHILTDPTPIDAAPRVMFTDITREAGIDFVHFNGATGKLLMPEAIGSGGAFFDYDRDGRQDILIINGSYFPGHEQPGAPPTMALYHNDGHGHFTNVTRGSGLDVSIYGMGVAIADYDGDGWPDVFVTALGSNHLFRNLGNGRFEDVTAKAGVAGEPHRWSTSAGFLDYDNDGYLDLFVCNYVEWSEELDDKLDHYIAGIRDYLPPWQCPGTHSYLYHNNGDGTFTDVSQNAGIQVVNSVTGVPKGKGQGVVICDLDEDGWLDIVVANDGGQVFLFHNNGDGTFREIGEAAGVGNAQDGLPIAGMGIDAGQLHESRQMTVGVGNLIGHTTAMFHPQGGPLTYVDTVLSCGIAAATQRYTTWGLFFFDYDLDGRLDLGEFNGSIMCEECNKLNNTPHLQPSQLFWNCGPGQMASLTPLPTCKRIPALDRGMMARGAAFADIDGDGDLDVLVVQNNRPAVLLRNDQQLGHHWIRLQLEGDGGNREAIGARIEARVGGQVLCRRVLPTRSYLSQCELPVTIGLGNYSRPEEVRVIWPDGSQQLVADVRIDGLTNVKKTTPRKSITKAPPRAS